MLEYSQSQTFSLARGALSFIAKVARFRYSVTFERGQLFNKRRYLKDQPHFWIAQLKNDP